LSSAFGGPAWAGPGKTRRAKARRERMVSLMKTQISVVGVNADAELRDVIASSHRELFIEAIVAPRKGRDERSGARRVWR
jgi:hypothetical protein